MHECPYVNEEGKKPGNAMETDICSAVLVICLGEEMEKEVGGLVWDNEMRKHRWANMKGNIEKLKRSRSARGWGDVISIPWRLQSHDEVRRGKPSRVEVIIIHYSYCFMYSAHMHRGDPMRHPVWTINEHDRSYSLIIYGKIYLRHSCWIIDWGT